MDNETKLPVVLAPEPEDLQDSELRLLKPVQQRFVHLYLSGGYKLKDIAQLLNVAPATLSVWLRNPDIKDIIDNIQQDEDGIVRQMLKATRLKAMQKMSDLIDSPVDGIAWQAAKDILDRTGHKPTVKQEINVEVKTFEEQIKELAIEVEATDADYEDIDT